MSLYLLDTDHVSLYQMGHPRILQQILSRLHDQLAITVITVEEQLSG
jgi:tRNA(fMet)-specific endonuclease VapC